MTSSQNIAFLQDWVQLLIEGVRTVKGVQGTPPYSSRLFGILGVSLYVAAQKTFPNNSVLLQDVVDGWKVGARSARLRDEEFFIGWMEASWAVVLRSLAAAYLPSISDETLRSTYEAHQKRSTQGAARLMACLSPWDPQKPPLPLQEIRRLHQLWREDLEIYFRRRDDDGWKAAQVVPPDTPNLGLHIPVGNFEIEEKTDLSKLLPSPEKYTPLAIYNQKGEVVVKQGYLGAQFGKVDISNLLPAAFRQTLTELVVRCFPTVEQRKKEILRFQTPPDDFGRANAETWAGSFPGFYNPPSQMLWLSVLFLRNHSGSYQDALLVELSVMLNLFLVAVVAWDLKYKLNQSRPIQDFRLWYPELEIEQWDGSSTTGKHWLPYQPRLSPTPPFPDIPSGHSCFSAVLANTLLLWTGNEDATLPYGTNSALFEKISPCLSPAVFPTTNGCSLLVAAGSSSIDPRVSPNSPVALNTNSWPEIAALIGRSRVQGGIHTESSNIVSRAMAQELVNYATRQFFLVGK